MESIENKDEGAGALRYPKLSYDLWRYRGEPGQLIPLLQAAQDAWKYVPEAAIQRISGVTGISESDIYGVVTFYKQFRLRPMGKHLVRICDGTACHVNGAGLLKDVLADELHLESGDTTEDGLFTLQPVACLGCCSLAPAMMVGEETFGRLTAQMIRRILRKYR